MLGSPNNWEIGISVFSYKSETSFLSHLFFSLSFPFHRSNSPVEFPFYVCASHRTFLIHRHFHSDSLARVYPIGCFEGKPTNHSITFRGVLSVLAGPSGERAASESKLIRPITSSTKLCRSRFARDATYESTLPVSISRAKKASARSAFSSRRTSWHVRA